MYAIIDVETTGGSPSVDRVIEIAVFVFDGATPALKKQTTAARRRCEALQRGAGSAALLQLVPAPPIAAGLPA